MRSSGDGGNARDGLLAVESIQGGDEGHVDDIEEEEKLKAAEKGTTVEYQTSIELRSVFFVMGHMNTLLILLLFKFHEFSSFSNK